MFACQVKVQKGKSTYIILCTAEKCQLRRDMNTFHPGFCSWIASLPSFYSKCTVLICWNGYAYFCTYTIKTKRPKGFYLKGNMVKIISSKRIKYYWRKIMITCQKGPHQLIFFGKKARLFPCLFHISTSWFFVFAQAFLNGYIVDCRTARCRAIAEKERHGYVKAPCFSRTTQHGGQLDRSKI